MSSTNSLSSHLEDLRSRNPQSPPAENGYSGYSTPVRYSLNMLPTHSQPLSEARASLQRRFTADSGRVPTLSSPGQQSSTTGLENVDVNPNTLFKIRELERKKMEYERIREQRERFDAELDRLKMQQDQQAMELEQMSQDLRGMNVNSGHQSEPATPPEYRDQSFPSIYARRNRYSSSSLVSPSNVLGRPQRSGSFLTSPPIDASQVEYDPTATDKLPSKSVPGSRRGSNDRIPIMIPENGIAGPRSSAAKNRYSMPITSSYTRRRESTLDDSDMLNLGHINTTNFLFGDEDDKPTNKAESVTSPDVTTYLQMNTTDDKFPILVRNNKRLSASSAALDLASPQAPDTDLSNNGWPNFARNRLSQQSLPPNGFDLLSNGLQKLDSPPNTSRQSIDNSLESPLSVRQLNRRSIEATLADAMHKEMQHQKAAKTFMGRPSLGNMQSPYSTNDIPTLKNPNGLTSPTSPPKSRAEQQFHNHNASLGRIPAHAISNSRHSREMPGSESREEIMAASTRKSFHSDLHASAAPFGPALTQPTSAAEEPTTNTLPTHMPQYGNPAFYGGYGMQQLVNMGLSPLAMNSPMGFASQMPMYQAPGMYPGINGFQQQPSQQQQQQQQPPLQAQRLPDSQQRVMQQRRAQNSEDVTKFTNMKLADCQGHIYQLCKDQHGCRFLQKQIETKNEESVRMIFAETNQHVVELMTDPFGNYLCQKLLEFSNDDQRTALINNAAPSMVQIALNQHGTRALQKMIEFISSPVQVQTIIMALRDQVVQLIQDLNGNHVIQKCLNRLSAIDSQFIFDAVGDNCVTVGTHRHGCCVLQRCIDHASGYQRAELIRRITEKAFELVQDPFGNYVLQYIVDLNEPLFTNPLCLAFRGRVPVLSKQKFSSNVVEKCLRGAEPEVTALLIVEMLDSIELEKMLRDSFANYVVQTALDYADSNTRNQLVEAIKPIIPAIRSTPYGRRIQSKILGHEGNGRGGVNIITPETNPIQAVGGRHIVNDVAAMNNNLFTQNRIITPMNGVQHTQGYNPPHMNMHPRAARGQNRAYNIHAQVNGSNANNVIPTNGQYNLYNTMAGTHQSGLPPSVQHQQPLQPYPQNGSFGFF
ncbi:hypothetical protein MMC25_000871 [Agyrium rufum]|nr:hypothetical protein [Agyrium rufum]